MRFSGRIKSSTGEIPVSKKAMESLRLPADTDRSAEKKCFIKDMASISLLSLLKYVERRFLGKLFGEMGFTETNFFRNEGNPLCIIKKVPILKKKVYTFLGKSEIKEGDIA